MRLAIFADGEVGFEITFFLLDEYFEDVSVVVTLENRRIAELAERYGCRNLKFTTEEEMLALLPREIDIGLLAWWPKIMKYPLINYPKMGFINTHPSLLPFNRGKHYNFWALVEQSPFGVTLHRVDEGIDSGEIIAQKSIAYDWTDTGGSLYKKAQKTMLSLFKETWPILREGNLNYSPQPIGIGSFHRAQELEKASKIDLNKKYFARDLLNLLRARTFPPHPACWFEENGHCFEVSIHIKKVVK